MMAGKPPKVMAKTKPAADREEESIYGRINPGAGVAPVIRTYIIQPTESPAAPNAATPSPKGAGGLRMHDNSSQVNDIFNPIHGPRDAQVRAGVKPANHARSNISAVKEQSNLNQLRKISSQHERAGESRSAAASRSTSAPSRKPMQRHGSNDEGRDFMAENRMGAGAPVRLPKINPSKEDGLKYLHKPDFGRVPTYLLERKIEAIEQLESNMRAKEASMIPQGMRMLAEDERMETLSVLQKNRSEIERALQALPLRIETPGQIRRRDDLERRMREIEEGLKVFSRPKVMVKL